MPASSANSPDMPTGSLSRFDIRRALRLWTVEAQVSTVQITLTGGAFQIGFALFLGCSDFWIGALASIPAFAGLLQLVSSYYAQRFARKTVVIWCALISRLLWVPMLLIPFVLPPSDWVGAFLTLILVSSLFANISAPLWTAWISDLVPEDYRGRYFGRRNMYAGLVGMTVSIVGGWFLDSATHHQQYSEPMAFAVIFAVGTLFAFGSFWCGARSPDVPRKTVQMSSSSGSGALAAYAAPFADTNFRRIIVFYAGFVVAQTFAAQFFTVYQLKYLALNYTALQLLGAVSSLASLAAMPLWGYLADKYGNKPILMISCALVVLPPLLWIMTAPDGIPGLWRIGSHGGLHLSYTKLNIIVLNTIAGVGWAGVGLSQFNLMIGASPAARRAVYVSAIAAVNGLAGGIAPLLGGALMQALASVHFPAHGLIRSNYDVLFLLSGLMRAGFALLLRPVQEAGSNTARYVLGQLKATKPIGSMASLHRLSRGNSAQARSQAAEELGRLKTPVAVEELVRALDDVSLPVREQAAVALGEIGDARAVSPLVEKLTDPAAGITGAAATALGKIGDRSALPALAAAAQLGPPSRQVAAVEALGHLPDPRATEILLGMATHDDPAVRTAAIRALSEREDPRSSAALAEQLTSERDPAMLTILADSLGRLGDAAAIPALISALDRSASATVRREIVNAVGSIAGGRDSFYPYLALDSLARDETVAKLLMNLQRRFRARAAQESQAGAARLSIRAKQALESYVSGDYRECIHRLALLARTLAAGLRAGDPHQAAFAALFALDSRAHRLEEEISAEETLLAVFLVQQITRG